MSTHVVPPIPRSLTFRDDDKPYVESIHGRLERKVSPRRVHARLQIRLGRWLEDWAGSRGEVGSEWRFYFVSGEGRPSSLLPDVAYVSYVRLPRTLPEDARERPRLAPDIAVEIWSPGDRTSSVAEKVKLYLAHGATIVIVVNPAKRTVAFHGRSGVTVHEATGKLPVPGYGDLELDTDWLFSDL
jgi:Uma2 family endonuclease